MDAWLAAIRKTIDMKPGRLARRLAERYGYDGYIVERWLRLLGEEETRELLEANEKPLPETIRCNNLVVDCGELKDRLEDKGFQVSMLPFTPFGMEVSGGEVRIGATHEYLKGFYYIQDPGSMTVVDHLQPLPGETILDAAAAPGGKATQILQYMMDTGLLVAVEISRKRMRALRSHMSRMRLSSYILVRADSRHAPQGIMFDRILLDAPSSGEGIIRKDPARKQSRNPRDLVEIHERQYTMLHSLVDRLKPGGLLVYAACTTAVEEGEAVIDRLLALRSDVRVEPPSYPYLGSRGFTSFDGVEFDRQVAGCIRLWPHIHGTEGFFICRIRRLHT